MTVEQITLIYHGGIEPVVEIIQALEKENQLLACKNKLLEEKFNRLNRDSTESHKPPSSDGLKKKPRPRKRGSSGRKPGGQKDHEGKARPIIPPEKIDRIIPYKADKCEKCHEQFADNVTSKPVECHQVTELPEIKPIFENHVVYQTQCPCGRTICPCRSSFSNMVRQAISRA